MSAISGNTLEREDAAFGPEATGLGVGGIGLTLLVVLALAGAAVSSNLDTLRAMFGPDAAQTVTAPSLADEIREVEVMSVDDKAQILAEGGEAEERNAAIPLTAVPVEVADRFVLTPDAGETYATALRCLTQAVYYEAATEPLNGRRAVAQVVLNRVRHPAYPGSVCGVVYEGSARRTGCQFSFTCDGSLLRAPTARYWREAEAVARRALAGSVEASVGSATNYHADYVLPKWAFSLAKIEQIGRHIFYRLPGRWGGRGVFTDAYAGGERIPAIDFAMLRARLAEAAADGGNVVAVTPGLSVPPAVTDRHAPNDVGGRIDVSKEWRLSIPDPASASSRYRALTAGDAQPVAATTATASAPVGSPLAVAAKVGPASGVSVQ